MWLPKICRDQISYIPFSLIINKTKVLSVQLGKTFSSVKFVVELGGDGLGGVKLWIVVH